MLVSCGPSFLSKQQWQEDMVGSSHVMVESLFGQGRNVLVYGCGDPVAFLVLVALIDGNCSQHVAPAELPAC
jgi:hypothetical protein